MSRESLGILIGLLLTDGCVSDERFLIFHNKSEVMHKEFRKHVNKLFGDVHFTERFEVNGTKRTQLTSKKIVSRLLSLSKMTTFRKKQFDDGEFPETKLPFFIKNLSRSSMSKFLQTIFSADGSISVSARWHKRNNSWEIRRRVELTCKNPYLRKDFYNLIENFGFSPRVSNENITLERKSDILRFTNSVRFIPNVTIGGDSKYWRGFEKNQILDLAVKSFDFGKQNLIEFNKKEDVMKFLKSHISTL